MLRQCGLALAGVVVGLIGLSFAEVSTTYDRIGGPLVYAQEAMGKTAGFTVGWMVSITHPVRQPATEPTKLRSLFFSETQLLLENARQTGPNLAAKCATYRPTNADGKTTI
jgi:hypothetical protein